MRYFFILLYNFMINNAAKVIKVKHYMYNVLLLFNCNKLNYIKSFSLGKKCLFLLLGAPRTHNVLLFLLVAHSKRCHIPSVVMTPVSAVSCPFHLIVSHALHASSVLSVLFVHV